MSDRFSFDVRVLMCRNCGAPLETGFTGGNVKCAYCGTTNHFHPRKEEPVEPAAAAVEMDEDARMELLRRQDGIQPEIPTELKPLIHQGELAPWKVDEALSLWQSTCRELASSNDYGNAELLYYLTIVLSNHFSGEDDDLRERAMYESALEVLTLPRHRQLMRGFLTRKAALAGQTEAAGKWLAPCNPRSQDLESDSSYRISKAEIFTVNQDWNGVLGILGESIDSVPVSATCDGKALVQRANALEHLGRTEEAAQHLYFFMNVNGTQGRDALRQMLSVYSDAGFSVCSLSMEKAESLFNRSSGVAASQMKNPGGCFGQMFAVTGVLLIILSVVLGIVLKSGGQEFPIGASITVALVGVVFFAIGIGCVMSARKVVRLHTSGRDEKARVKSMTPTGWKVNDVPQYRIQLEVLTDEPYTVEIKKTIPDSGKPGYSPGSELHVKVDPKDPKNISVVD